MEFDCLYAGGKDLRGQPLYVRRNVVEDVLDGQDLVLPVRRLADDGLTAWAEVLARGTRASWRRIPSRATCRGGRTPGSR
jgi:ATP-dependent DNA ligase